MTDKTKFYFKELKLLRDELNNLKECQVRYFTFSITATGLILGIIARLDDKHMSGMLFLLPLMVLIPAWLVFFDKAKTITRIVAYYRFLESIILNNVFFNFVGWENSLMIFREWEAKTEYSDFKQDPNFFCTEEERCEQESKIRKIKNILPNISGSYWFLINLTFAGLILVCILISLFKGILAPYGTTGPTELELNFWIIIVCIALFYISFIFNYVIVYSSLTRNGRHSYTTNMKIWCNIFGIDYCNYTHLINGHIRVRCLFNDNFMNNFTNYDTFNDLLSGSDLSRREKDRIFNATINQSQIEYDNLSKNEYWNSIISKESEFMDWDEMLQEAKYIFLKK